MVLWGVGCVDDGFRMQCGEGNGHVVCVQRASGKVGGYVMYRYMMHKMN